METVVYLSLSFCVVMVALLLGTAIFAWRLYSSESNRHEEEKHELRKMIRDLQNRLSAKDLTGYIALRDSDGKQSEPITRTDEQLADLEAARIGLQRMPPMGIQ